MADIPTLTLRARLEMGDRAGNFTAQMLSDGVTNQVLLDHKPVSNVSVSVFPQTGLPYSLTNSDYLVDNLNGVVLLSNPAPNGATVQVDGQAYRYFSDSDWQTFFLTALGQHLLNRAGPDGQPVLLANLPVVEEYPVVLLAITHALYALLNEASFDVDISTPEGVHIPRGQRVEQLWRMLAERQREYKDICAALNVGLWKVDMFDLRRKSYRTNRLVPVYQAQEFQDTRFPRQIFTEIPTDGATPQPVPTYQQTINLVAYSAQDFVYTVTLGQSVVGSTVRASIRRYPASLTPMVYMDVTVLDGTNGVIQVHVSALLNFYVGVSKFWDLQVIDSKGNVQTLVGGKYDAIRQGGY